MSILRAAAVVLSGNAAASLLGLLRNLAVARLITVEDFGIAATFAIALSVIEMISALGIEQQLIQARDGEEERLQSALQGFQFLRGIVNAIVLFLLAGPIANFMNLGHLTWAYQLMALVPLIRGFHHLDANRISRSMQFGPMMLTQVIPFLVAFFSVWPLALWLSDYRVMIGVILIQSATTMVFTHLVAERPYRMIFDRQIIGRSFRFGWPIMLNGLLLFGVFQGDRLIVGREVGIEALAIFSMAVTLTMAPMLLLTKSFQNLFLPLLSKVQDQPRRFDQLATATLQITLLAGLVLVAAAVAVGQPLAMLLLSEKYSALMPLLSWVALAQAIRMVNGGPAIVALALAETTNAMYANLSRIAALPLIWYVAILSRDLVVIAQIAVVAEAVALGIALALLRYKAGVGLGGILPAFIAAVPLVLFVVFQALRDSDFSAQYASPLVMMSLALLVLTVAWQMPEFRKYFRRCFRKRT
jgi:O-antigen/teichoic acid export membrane protein